MNSIDLGTISATVALDLRPFNQAAARLKAGIKEIDAALDGLALNPDGIITGADFAGKSLKTLGSQMEAAGLKLRDLNGVKFNPAGITDGATVAKDGLKSLGTAATGTRARLQSLNTVKFSGGGITSGAAKAGAALDTLHGKISRTMTLLGGLGNAGANIAAGVVAVAGVSTRNAVNFSGAAQQIAGNTNMTAADQAAMKRSALDAMRMGLSPDGAMKSFMHITNHDFGGQQAVNINRMAGMMSVGTGADMESAGQVLAGFLHQLKMVATSENVSRVANLQHQATASGDMTLENFIKYGAPAAAKAYALGNSPADSMAFLTALTKQQVRIPQAATNLAGITWQVTHPNPKAQDAIDAAGLSQYFGPDALKKHGLYNILGATEKGVGGDKSKLMSIFGNKQGGFGALIATGPGAADYKDQIYNPRTGNLAAFGGRVKPVEERYQQQANNPAQKVKALQGELSADSIAVGEKFIPVLTKLLPLIERGGDGVLKFVGAFAKLPLPVQEGIAAVGAFQIASLALGNPLVGLGEGIGALVTKLAPLEGGIGGVAAAFTEVAPPVAAAVAVVAGLAVAWQKDLGGIREFVGAQVKQISGFFKTEMPQIQLAVKTVLATMQQLWHDHGARIMAVLTPLWNVIKATIKNAIGIIESVIRAGLDLITGNWKGLGRDLLGIVGNLWDELKSLFINGVKAVGNTLLLLISAVIDVGKRLLTAALHVGQSIVSGMVEGIKGKISEVANAASQMASSAVSAAKSKLDIHSPSRVMHIIGEQTAQGMADGILAGVPHVTEAMRQMTAAALRETDPLLARLKIRQDARALEAGGMKKTAVAGWRDASLTGISERAAASGDGDRQEKEAQRHFTALSESQAKIDKVQARFADTMAEITDRISVMKADPETLSLDRAEASAKDKYRQRVKALGGDPSLSDAQLQAGPYSPRLLSGFKQAGAERDLTLGAIGDERAAKAAREQQARDEELKRQLDSVRKEADETRSLRDNEMQYELSTGKVTTAAYKDYLSSRLKDYQAYSAEWMTITDQIHEIDVQEWQKEADALKQQFDAKKLTLTQYQADLKALLAGIPNTPQNNDVRQQIGDKTAKVDGKAQGETVGGERFWGGLASSAADNGSKVLEALFHPKNKEKIFKSIGKDLVASLQQELQGGLSSLLKNLLTGNTGGLGSLFGGLFGGKKSGGTFSPQGLYTAAGMGTDPGMGGGGNPLGALGGLFGGGGALGGAMGAAAPWLAGLAAFSALNKSGFGGGLLGLVFKPWAKLFKGLHFSGGGVVPGLGHGDTVPAMLTPGEVVLNAGQQKRLGGGAPITVNHYGDIHNGDGMQRTAQDLAWLVKRQLAVVTPGT